MATKDETTPQLDMDIGDQALEGQEAHLRAERICAMDTEGSTDTATQFRHASATTLLATEAKELEKLTGELAAFIGRLHERSE